MTQEPSGWYADPTARHVYRYWNGVQWTDQVTDGGRSGIDPVPVAPPLATTPPGPGTQAPGQDAPLPPRESAPPRKSNWLVTLVVMLVVLFVVVGIAAAIVNYSSDDSDSGDTNPPTSSETAPPDTTEEPDTPDEPETPDEPDTSETTASG